jgi:hypothetical protein
MLECEYVKSPVRSGVRGDSQIRRTIPDEIRWVVEGQRVDGTHP